MWKVHYENGLSLLEMDSDKEGIEELMIAGENGNNVKPYCQIIIHARKKGNLTGLFDVIKLGMSAVTKQNDYLFFYQVSVVGYYIYKEIQDPEILKISLFACDQILNNQGDIPEGTRSEIISDVKTNRKYYLPTLAILSSYIPNLNCFLPFSTSLTKGFFSIKLKLSTSVNSSIILSRYDLNWSLGERMDVLYSFWIRDNK